MTGAPEKPRTVDEAEQAISAAIDQVVKDGGTIHEDAIWDVSEMALDGASKQSMVDRLRRNAAMPYTPQGGWRAR